MKSIDYIFEKPVRRRLYVGEREGEFTFINSEKWQKTRFLKDGIIGLYDVEYKYGKDIYEKLIACDIDELEDCIHLLTINGDERYSESSIYSNLYQYVKYVKSIEEYNELKADEKRKTVDLIQRNREKRADEKRLKLKKIESINSYISGREDYNYETFDKLIEDYRNTNIRRSGIDVVLLRGFLKKYEVKHYIYNTDTRFLAYDV
jgi:hypothetical protein